MSGYACLKRGAQECGGSYEDRKTFAVLRVYFILFYLLCDHALI
jgi:hypothetical protein